MPPLKSLDAERLSLVVATLGVVEEGQVVHGRKRKWMVVAQDASLSFQRLDVERFGLLVAPARFNKCSTIAPRAADYS